MNNWLLRLCTTVAVTGRVCRVLFVKLAVAHAHAKKTPVDFASSTGISVFLILYNVLERLRDRAELRENLNLILITKTF